MKYRSGLRRDVLNVECCRSLLVAALLLSLTSVGAQPLALRVIDEEAIPFAGFLSKVEFDQRYPGKIVAEPAELDGGWYVIYEHETLNYYFGPILLRSTGEDYFAQLGEIVEAAVAQRPGINGYRLELSYEPSRTWSSPATEGAASSESSTSAPIPQVQPPSQNWGVLDFFRRLLGL